MPNNVLIHMEDAINTALDWSVKPGGEVFNAIKAAIESRIKQVPAVDAIPLDWLEEAQKDGPPENRMAAWRVANMWEAEKRRRQNG